MHRIPETVELAQTLKEVPKKRQFNSEQPRLRGKRHKTPVMTVVQGEQIQAADPTHFGAARTRFLCCLRFTNAQRFLEPFAAYP
jgi:hypothetical protein